MQDADLLNFQRYDVEFDALRPGEGIACTEAEALSEAQSLRPDGFRDVLVNSRDLLEIFPAKRNTKKTAEFDAAERWLVEELAKDPHRRSAKMEFWEASRDAGQTFSRRIFERVWEKHGKVDARLAARHRARKGAPPNRNHNAKYFLHSISGCALASLGRPHSS